MPQDGVIVRWLRRIVIALLALVFIVIGVAVAGSSLSLDRTRAHTRETEALPLYAGFGEPQVVRIPARGMEFRARIAGDRGPGVILLHGFPVTSAMYIPLIEAAASAGYRVVAFDQRGYSPGARPASDSQYVVSELVQDVLAIADAVGFERFHLVGHDWGAAVGWTLVTNVPERVETWTGLAIPHPAAFVQALASDPDQQTRSSYFLLFSAPWVPEIMFTWNGLALLRDGVYAPMSESQREEYLRVFAEPGALTAALDWYRALAASREQATAAAPPAIATPTLFAWGNQDGSVGRVAVEAQRSYMTGPFREVELDAGHWLLEEHTDRIVAETLAHLRGERPPAIEEERDDGEAVPEGGAEGAGEGDAPVEADAPVSSDAP
jgi:pimeloyl-ACP methyl ester carboxylesterase